MAGDFRLKESNDPATVDDGRSPLVLRSSVLFIEDVAQVLRTSRSTIERRRRGGTFPIPELPGIDGRPRWSWQAVERYLLSSGAGLARRGRPAKRTRT